MMPRIVYYLVGPRQGEVKVTILKIDATISLAELSRVISESFPGVPAAALVVEVTQDYDRDTGTYLVASVQIRHRAVQPDGIIPTKGVANIAS